MWKYFCLYYSNARENPENIAQKIYTVLIEKYHSYF